MSIKLLFHFGAVQQEKNWQAHVIDEKQPSKIFQAVEYPEESNYVHVLSPNR